MFQLFDEDKTGFITFRNLKRVCQELNENLYPAPASPLLCWRWARAERCALRVCAAAQNGRGDSRDDL